MLTYALGRELDYYDECQITCIKIRRSTRTATSFSALVLGIVQSYPFQYRRNADQPPAEAPPLYDT